MSTPIVEALQSGWDRGRELREQGYDAAEQVDQAVRAAVQSLGRLTDPTAPTLHRNPLRLDVPEDTWRIADEEDGRAKLIATLNLSGLLMHLEAFEVVRNSSPQRTVVEADNTDAIHSAVHGDGPWDTLTIRGREYVVVATPYC